MSLDFGDSYIDEEYLDWLSDKREREERYQWLHHLFHIEHFVWHKNFRRELRQAVLHPDRCVRMRLAYGDTWVDTHFP